MTYLKKLATYNFWANNRVLQAFETIEKQLPESSLRLFSHLLNAQLIWISRIGNINSPVSVFSVHDLVTCRQLHEESSGNLIKLVSEPKVFLEEKITYANTQGDSFTNSVEDILLQVLTHGTYNRAQIARDLRQNAFVPPNTDYITYVREQ